MNEKNLEIVKAYFAAFNAGETQKMTALLHPEVQHEINQGHVEVGVEAFKKFMSHMDECYKEELKDMTVFSSVDSAKFSAEYDVHGTYLKTDGSLPVARGQKYVIRAGSFLEVRDEKIARVTTYYNLPKWIEMVKNG
ncbi:MAG: nuclear transport factor 2 family protein [Bdellovibrionaceae bacterium]|nr:nuclear transport factor 2 family protein [Pseudobdellovibrionaceae bacterium]